ncbi:MAG TPA: glutamate formimidoyltransferase [Terriglobales bacterium]|nr:glutamate formimidoyltransferase [Terriglobales bacterium]
MPLIECVPNFSEGRDAAVVDALVAIMLAVPGVSLLDREMDADHHRSVITIAGEPQPVAEAAVRAVGLAAERIDLRRHQGAHPRLGATDVVPFVPLEGATLEECVRLAEWAGAEIWRRFQIPVYLYEAAARRPERRGLENIRKGQFEGVREEIQSDPYRAPDFGLPFPQARLHPSAGATVVGARKFLIAYNINLDTPDVSVAKTIAKTIRTSGGGLPALKSMGVQLSDPARAQVSMNLTDFELTSLATAWRAVETEAARHGAHAVESELIGLVPRQAMENAAAEMLRFVEFDSQRVVEARVASVMAARPMRFATVLQPFLDALASEEPAPGGGTAAAAAGAMAAALGRMVARVAWAKLRKTQPDSADQSPWPAAAAEMQSLGEELARATDEDSESFLAIRAARRLPKAAPDEQAIRQAAIVAATVLAAEVPLGVATRCLRLHQLLRQFQTLAPAAMASDLTTGQALAQAGFRGARDNVRINLDSLPESDENRRRIAAALAKLEAAAPFSLD